MATKTDPLIKAFALYGVIFGAWNLILLPLFNSFWGFENHTYAILDDIGMIVAALAALMCSAVVLKARLKGDWGDKLVYFVFIGVWVALTFAPLFRGGGIEWP